MKLGFNRFAYERAFRSAADFARYADDQIAKFESLQGEHARDFQNWGKTVAGHWARAAGIAKAEGATEDSIQDCLNTHPVFAWGSSLTRVLGDLIAQGKDAGAQEVIPFLTGRRDKLSGANVHVVQLNAHAAFQIALASETTSRPQGRSSFADMLSEHEERLSEMLQSDHDQLEAKRGEFDRVVAQAKDHFATAGADVSAKIQSWNATWLETHNAFIEQLATETAVELWRARSSSHETRYKGIRKWTIGLGVAGLLVTLMWIFGGFAFARYIFPSDKTAQLASYAAGSLALFTLFVWGLRVLVRSMISEDHLSTDASARSALAHTYLALTKDNAATPEDRAIILATLFAPVSDGLVKDDGMPAFSPAAIAAQILTNPGR